MLAVLLAATLAQTPFTFRSDGGVLTMDATARVRLLAAADGTELQDGAFVPIAVAVVAGVDQPATALHKETDGLEVAFGTTGVTARIAVEEHPEGIVFRVIKIGGPTIESLRFLSISTRGLPERGRWLNVRAGDSHAVCVLGLSPRVDAAPWGGHGLGATVYPAMGTAGEGAALVIAPRNGLLDAVRKAERAFGLPSPTLGGKWAKQSDAAKGSYLFTDLTAANVDQTIRYAKLGGFKSILIYAGTWASSNGTYAIHPQNYPGGEATLTRVVEECRAAGLRVGLHVLTSMVSKNDPLASPPDPRLLADAAATLAKRAEPGDTTLNLGEALDAFPEDPAHYGNAPGGTDVRIGSEVIRYGRVDRSARRLLGCKRGVAGTRATSHDAGAKVEHLAERYDSYLADLRTSLLPQISERLSGLINRCGIGMVYFDGGENAMPGGPYWFWVGRVQDEVLKRVKGDILVQGSGITHWSWHWLTRGTCDDYAALAPAAYLDTHKIADAYAEYRRDFLPAELGWWGLLAGNPAWPATSLADVDAYGARMVAWDSAVGAETTLDQLRSNPQTDSLLARLAQWERVRGGTSVSGALKVAMRKGEWTLPGPTRVSHELVVLEATQGATLHNPFEAQTPTIRLEVLPELIAGQPSLIAGPVPVPLPPSGSPMPGWAARRTPVSADLSSSRALQVVLEASAGAANGVLNVQLEAAGRVYRDHLLDVRAGRNTYTLAGPSAERVLREYRPALGNYAYKASVYAFDYSKITALNVRWMRAPSGGTVVLRSVVPLREAPATLVRPVLRLNTHDLAIPTTLRAGDSVAISADGRARVFDAKGRPRTTLSLGPLPQLPAGNVSAKLLASGAARVRLTVEFRSH